MGLLSRFVAICVVLVSLLNLSNAVKIKIAAGSTECVSQTFDAEHFAIPGGPRIDGRVLIGTSSHYYRPFVSIRLLSPTDDQIWQQQHVYSEAHFNAGARGPGTYKACFYNPWESRTDAIVDLIYFSLAHLRTPNAPIPVPKGVAEERKYELAHADHVDQARQAVAGMSEFMQVIAGSQKYLERKLDRHRQTLESNRHRALVYSSVEVVTIAMVLATQVFAVHGLFGSGIANRVLSSGIGARLFAVGGGSPVELRGPGALLGGAPTTRRHKVMV